MQARGCIALEFGCSDGTAFVRGQMRRAVNKMRPLDFAKAAASAAKAVVSAELCRTLLEEMGKDAAQLPTLSLQHLQR